jgi:dTDP-glucose pyrophosphorylase
MNNLTVAPDATLRAVMERINANLRGIALVVDADGRLLGSIVDGDIRRAILASIGLDATAADILRARGGARPVTAPAGSSSDALLELMRRHRVRQIPILDADGRLAGLVTQDDLLPDPAGGVQAMIMAGGRGVRLRPLTEEVPKPMLPVGGRPLMELMIERMRRAGITRFHIATHYKSDKIVDHFGSGDQLGVELNYVNEDRPRGTAGALSMIPSPSDTTLVINGDILTDVDFNAMLAFHREYNAALTVAVRRYEIDVPFGVVETEGVFARALTEKPHVDFLVNAGIYLIEPAAHRFIENREHLDMPDLIRRLIEAGEAVVNFPVIEYWIDIGAPHDYLKAQEDAGRPGGPR